jgi:hypothetical protein
MRVWIQHSDFSEEEFDLDLDSTLKMLQDTDWMAELAKERKLLESGKDSCPPGLGVDHPTERILHICPKLSGAVVHYHYPVTVMKFLRRTKSLTLENVNQDQVESFIHAFFGQEWKTIEGHAFT